MAWADEKEFEDEVRRIARARWPQARHAGAGMRGGRERDGVFPTEDLTHHIECTTSGRKAKAEQDIWKLVEACREDRKHNRLAIGWFVTAAEPTGEQQAVAAKYKDVQIRVVAFDSFLRSLIDAGSYLRDRQKYAFGSARDPDTGNPQVHDAYVPLEFDDADAKRLRVDDLAALIEDGRRIVLLGDYGSGKSMTCKEIFERFKKSFQAGRSKCFPLHLNLRDHHGQTEPVEAIERHARRIGFEPASDLVRAWRAGHVYIILDGLDEIASPGWTGSAREFRSLRYRAVELVRKFIRETPPRASMLIAGRTHFFDTRREMDDALGTTPPFKVLHVAEFSEAQVESYLASKGWQKAIPSWVPRRPLLLSYLVSRGLLLEVLDVPAGTSEAAAWDNLIDRVAVREAEIEAGIDGRAVRRVLERLATMARERSDGLGPLTFETITTAFTSVSGHPPDDRGLVILQRLPGLGVVETETNNRQFIDESFADAARAGDVVEFIQNPFSTDLGDTTAWTAQLGPVGVGLAAYRATTTGITAGHLRAAFARAADNRMTAALAGDILRVVLDLGSNLNLDHPTALTGLWFPEIVIEDTSLGLEHLTLNDCLIERLELPQIDPPQGAAPRFAGCYIETIIGRSTEARLPSHLFDHCEFGAFEEEAQTTQALLQLDRPLGVRVLLTILKKLYSQRGSGRKESALYRGLDQRGQTLVNALLGALQRHGMVIRGRTGNNTVWYPVRGETARALQLLEARANEPDALYREAAVITEGS